LNLNRLRLGRRAALLLPLAAAGCDLLDDWFGEVKTPLPGERIPVMSEQRGLDIDNPDTRRITLPRPVLNADWPQNGGDPAHDMEHLAARDALTESWRAEIGEGGGYRRKITSRPVIVDGRVFTMDSDAVVRAFDAHSGEHLWRLDTRAKKDRSGNVGGGLGMDEGVLFATTGRGDALAIDPSDGKIRWRAQLGNAARAAPTLAEGRLYVPLIDGQLLALSQADGKRVWAYQGTAPDAGVLGLPSPAFADGIIVAGFGTGDLAAIRASTGASIWTDSLASNTGRNSLIDIPSIRGLPVIDQGQVFAIGLGGLMVAIDLRSGRRVWERDIGSAETPWLAGDWIFALTTDMQALALNRDDGTVAWVTPLPRFRNEKNESDPIRWIGPTLVADRLVFAGSIKRAVALSPYTGKVLGRQELSGAASVEPVVANGTLYIVTDDATLLALR
jgi:outer membrane protein assembly factor BamB